MTTGRVPARASLASIMTRLAAIQTHAETGEEGALDDVAGELEHIDEALDDVVEVLGLAS